MVYSESLNIQTRDQKFTYGCAIIEDTRLISILTRLPPKYLRGDTNL